MPVERVISILLGVHLWLHCACTAPQTELAAMAPALLAEAMEELLLGVLDGWAQASRVTGALSSHVRVARLATSDVR